MNNFFFYLAMYLCLFTEKYDERTNIILKISIFTGNFLISFILKFYAVFNINGKEIYVDNFFFPLIFQLIAFFIIKKREVSVEKKEYRQIKAIFALFLLGVLDLIILRRYLIEEVHKRLQKYEMHKIMFQCFLFLFYQIYGKMSLWFLQKLKHVISQNLFLLLIKIYITNVLCSCIVLSLTRKQGVFINVFSFINFFLQLFSLYERESFSSKILQHAFFLCKYIFKLKNKRYCKLLSSNIDNELASTIAGSTNELMISISLVILNIIISEKSLFYPIYLLKDSSVNVICKTNLVKYVSIGAENLCFLFAINFFYFLYLIMKMKDKQRTKFSWKMENYNLLCKSIYFILIYAYIDVSFQFYLYLDLIN